MSILRERLLPEIIVADQLFLVDAIARELIEKENQQNRIHVLEMLTLEDHHEFLFDKIRRKVVDGPWEERKPDSHQVYVWIRRMESLDPEGMKLLQELGQVPRLPEELPVVRICGTPFYSLETGGLFAEVANPWNRIYQSDLVTADGTEGFYFDRTINRVPLLHDQPPFHAETETVRFVALQPLLEEARRLRQHELVVLKKQDSHKGLRTTRRYRR